VTDDQIWKVIGVDLYNAFHNELVIKPDFAHYNRLPVTAEKSDRTIIFSYIVEHSGNYAERWSPEYIRKV
jgi:hypothetical protein